MQQKSLKKWLVAANGWQRVWFVCAVLTALYYVIIFPIAEANKGSSFRYEMKRATEMEMKNPICAAFMSGAFEKLSEPAYSTDGSTCYNIYIHRKYLDGHKPMSETTHTDHFKSEERERWLIYIGMGFLISTVLSVLLYGLGMVVSWIIKGFKKSEPH